MKYTTQTATEKALELLMGDSRAAHALPKHLQTLAAKIAEHAMCTLNEIEIADDIFSMHVDFLISMNPDLLHAVPSASQLAALEIEKAKTALAPEDKIKLVRKYEELEPEQRLAVLETYGSDVLKTKPPATILTDVEQRNAEIKRRFGRDPATMLPTERLSLHRKMIAEANAVDHDAIHRQAALDRVDGDASKLNPVERLSHHYRAGTKSG